MPIPIAHISPKPIFSQSAPLPQNSTPLCMCHQKPKERSQQNKRAPRFKQKKHLLPAPKYQPKRTPNPLPPHPHPHPSLLLVSNTNLARPATPPYSPNTFPPNTNTRPCPLIPSTPPLPPNPSPPVPSTTQYPLPSMPPPGCSKNSRNFSSQPPWSTGRMAATGLVSSSTAIL